ncbi:hypothetical protein [Capnocytophaga cynodegmi]|nr:hypothetical protein [Capnocytophaga cynodegmi]
MKNTWTLLVIVSVAAPTLLYLILYTINWIDSPFAVSAEKRKWVLYGYISLLVIIALKIITIDKYPILYLYIINLALGCFIIIFMQFFKLLGSLPVMLMGGITGFAVFLSIFYNIDLLYVISTLVFISGLVASSQIYLFGKTLLVCFLSWIIGFLPQICLLWLKF